MSEITGISWTDSTFNPWIGCTKVSQGCKNCYAERDNIFYKWTKAWGSGAERKRTSEANWKKPIQWARAAVKAGVTRRVFCASLADILDPEVPMKWQIDLCNLIDETGEIGGLEWLLLTKRPELIYTMIPNHWRTKPPSYVRLGVSAEDQPNWDKRIPKLLEAWTGKNFVSVEPMLGPVMLDRRVDWVICGCESGINARFTAPNWINRLLWDCRSMEIPFFLKQVMLDERLTKEPVWEGRQWLEFPAEATK